MNGGLDVKNERLRIRLRLEPGADAAAVLAAMEQALDRPIELRSRLRTVPVLSVLASRSELEILCGLPGVAKAEPEGRSELPPRPVKKLERE